MVSSLALCLVNLVPCRLCFNPQILAASLCFLLFMGVVLRSLVLCYGLNKYILCSCSKICGEGFELLGAAEFLRCLFRCYASFGRSGRGNKLFGA